MKIDVEQLKKIQGWLSALSEYGVDLSGDGGYLDVEEYEELPGEMEIEEICLSFPDDQEYYSISLEDFCDYMSDFDTIRRDGDTIVRTNHIIQAVINSERMGYTGFESKLESIAIKGDGMDVRVVKSPFLVGVMNAKDGRYEEDFGLGACEPYTAIEIRLEEEKDEKTIKELIERICFYLTDKLGVAIYPWDGPDIDELYDRMDEYYNSDEEEDGEDDEGGKMEDIASLPRYSLLLKMYRQAKGVDDPEIQYLQYYKIIEYVSPFVAKSVAYDHLNRKLDLLPSVARDSRYLDSLIAVAKKYDSDMRDDTLAVSVIENCVDVVPLFEMIPLRMRKKIKKTLGIQKDTITEAEVTIEQVRGLQKQMATILYATRNSIVHAKSNHNPTGNELMTEELAEVNEMMEIVARAIINWNQRQPEGFRL